MIHSLAVTVVHRSGLIDTVLLSPGLPVLLMLGLQGTVSDEMVPTVAIVASRHWLGGLLRWRLVMGKIILLK